MGDGEFLGAVVGFDAEGVAEFFAALGEGAAEEGMEWGTIGFREFGDGVEGEAEDGGVDVRLGVEDAAGEGF